MYLLFFTTHIILKKLLIKAKRRYYKLGLDFLLLCKMFTRTVYNNTSRPSTRSDYCNTAVTSGFNASDSVTFTRDQLLEFVNEFITKNNEQQRHQQHERNYARRMPSSSTGVRPPGTARQEPYRPVQTGNRRPTGNQPTRQVDNRAGRNEAHASNERPTSGETAANKRWSTNPDFLDLLKTTLQHARAAHSLSNWESVPQGVERAIDKLTASFRPPQSNATLRAAIQASADDFKSRVVANVQDHLTTTVQRTGSRLRELNQTDSDLVHEMVVRKLRTSLGRRYNHRVVENALRDAVDAHYRTETETEEYTVVGPGRGRPHSKAPENSTQVEPPTYSTGRFDVLRDMETADYDTDFPILEQQDRGLSTPQRTRGDDRRRKRSEDNSPRNANKRPEVRSTPPGTITSATIETTTNHSTAAGITDEQTVIAETQPTEITAAANDSFSIVDPTPPANRSPLPIAVETTTPLTTTAAPPTRRTGSRDPTRPASIAARLRCHSAGPRFVTKDSYFRLPNPAKGVDTAVLADSNGRVWTNTRPNWLTLSVAGARLQDVTYALREIVVHQDIRTVIIAVGINNSSENTTTITERLTALHAATEGRHFRTLIVETPQHPNASTEQARKVDHLNRAARDVFGTTYVALPSDIIVVSRSPDANERVHYDNSTATQIIAQLQQTVDAQKN